MVNLLFQKEIIKMLLLRFVQLYFFINSNFKISLILKIDFIYLESSLLDNNSI